MKEIRIQREVHIDKNYIPGSPGRPG